MSLAMSLRGRGPIGSASRTARVLSRFGATTGAMERCLDRYDAITGERGVRPTLPTTACVLARHPALLRRYAERGIELPVHGLVHGDHAVLDAAQQRGTIARAAEIFAHAGLKPVGFRGPYLRYNQATLDVLRELGFRYHSSQAVVFPLVGGHATRPEALASYELALELYSAVDATRLALMPRLRDGLVDIPVAVPDDEILVERLRWDEVTRAAQWRAMLEFTHHRGDLFTLQLHPERIPELGDALATTLSTARRYRPAVWIARLDEIASWWLRRSRFSLEVRRTERGFRVHFEGDANATLLVRGLDVPQSEWFGADAIANQTDFEAEVPRVPVVGISARSPRSVRALLAEEGFPFEISEDGNSYGAYIDIAATRWSEAAVLDAIDRAAGPLVRVGRWPDGARSALAVTGDIDALTIRDFLMRSWETRASALRRWQS
jgi:peptidoglycan/xylan/chitin deacetylase (PgdA/CDA1 family)